ncbi:MAG: Alcohol dehydrogenase GroES domain-containing protein [Parcubacteria group bacterium Gr01-1014_48]|nr:MAG: Alcohol dehydrogenase GroES domain-containing protein [Parcubacteria group bacterium Greene0416_14]TSC72801.1 MAG: Alcohol dehydrogenase GroES domain-containing protein [Parcubacteria group bacterium Gr01-1014_48]TSD00911.1 MAG: Alcohol dehydrogenase GroES domain-containing protein [Parcubacteria group bacterium Greene1014_15]TSD07993.1 MAG: Alcohol dehydrogenase GroES domain-containing protein [Parcubacteria group bacterium Greene0714_4]
MRAIVIDSESKGLKDGCNKTRTAHAELRNPKISVFNNFPKPSVGPTDILISVRACGVCGSDAAMVSTDDTGAVLYPFMMSSFIVPGHEFAGIVVDMGKNVKKYWPDLYLGDPVTAQCVLNCGFCISCKIGEFDHCANGDEIGFTKNGGMAEFCVVDMRHVWSLQPLVYVNEFLQADIFLAGSLVEPHAGVFKAISESRFQPGDNVLVIGLGPIGLSAINVFRALGAGSIVCCDPSERRRHIARTLGASFVFDPLCLQIYEEAMGATLGSGTKIVFEASGLAERNWTEIRRLLEEGPHGSQLIFFGQSKIDLTVNPQPFIQKYVSFSGSHGHTKVWNRIINLFAARRINPLPMITQTISIDEVPSVLPSMAHDKTQGKITITNFEGVKDATRV